MKPSNPSLTLDKYLQVIKRRWIPGLGVFLPVCMVSILASSLKKPIYQAVGKLFFHRTNTISSLTDVGGEQGKSETFTLSTEAEVISSISIVQKTIDKLSLKDEQGQPLGYNLFLNQLTISNVKDTDILQISYRDQDPDLAAKVVNTLMVIYLDYKESIQKSKAVSARKFIEKQLSKEELLIRQTETKLAQFKEKNNIISLQEEANKSVEMMANLQQKIGEIKAKMANVSTQVRRIRAQLNITTQQAVAFNSLRQSEATQNIIQEIQQLESKLENKRNVFQELHPEIVDMKSKLSALKKILQGQLKKASNSRQVDINGNVPSGELQQQLTAKLVELESIRLGLASELASLSTLESNYKVRLNNLPKLEKEQRYLERQVNAAQSTYLRLLQKLQEARIAENQIVSDAKQISAALVPEKPIASAKVYYSSAVFLSTLIALVTMCILEARDKTIKSAQEAQELLELPVLGVIPVWNKSNKSTDKQGSNTALSLPMVAMRDAPRSFISEAFRMLRANLNFVSVDKKLKIIVVTSSVPQEGKSTVAANLAMAMTQKEHSVLLVDGDLHRPSQHLIWTLPNQQGLSNVIMEEIEVMKAIRKVSSNLYVLTSGFIPPNPSSILDSQRMTSLVDSFAAYYDYVIIDAPSLNLAVDASTLGEMADGVLLVVRPGILDYGNATTACELLAKSGQNVIGQVVNAAHANNENMSKYYFQSEYELQDKANYNEVKQTN